MVRDHLLIAHRYKSQSLHIWLIQSDHYHILEADFEGDPDQLKDNTDFVDLIPSRADGALKCKGNSLKKRH